MSGQQTDAIIFDILSGDPVSPEEGRTWYDGSEDHLKARTATETVRVTEKFTTKVATLPTRVPSSGLQYLEIGGVATSSVPLIVVGTQSLRFMRLTVDVVDAKDYALEVVVNGSNAAVMHLLAGNTHKNDSFSLALTDTDEIQFRLRRTTGSGRSAFRSAVLETIFGE